MAGIGFKAIFLKETETFTERIPIQSPTHNLVNAFEALGITQVTTDRNLMGHANGKGYSEIVKRTYRTGIQSKTIPSPRTIVKTHLSQHVHYSFKPNLCTSLQQVLK